PIAQYGRQAGIELRAPGAFLNRANARHVAKNRGIDKDVGPVFAVGDAHVNDGHAARARQAEQGFGGRHQLGALGAVGAHPHAYLAFGVQHVVLVVQSQKRGVAHCGGVHMYTWKALCTSSQLTRLTCFRRMRQLSSWETSLWMYEPARWR